MSRFICAALIAVVASTVGIMGAGSAVADPAADITAVAVSTSVPTVYPHVDGYRDSVTISVDPTSTDGVAASSTGVLAIRKGSTVVRSWNLTGGTAFSVVWHGLVGSAIKSGTYSVSADYTNPDATTATAAASLIVSSRRLVAHHWSKTSSAGTVTNCSPGSPCSYAIVQEKGSAGHVGKAITGVRYRGVASTDEPFALSEVKLPSSILKSPKVVMNVAATMTIAGAKGRKFELAGCRHGSGDSCDDAQAFHGRTSSGKLTTANITMDSDTTYAAWMGVELLTGSSATVSTYTVHITYYTLS
jgi:hypothetical protein